MFHEFRAFLARGNVLELAVAVVVGGAFGRITTSLVNDILMPPLGLLIGGVDFANLGVILAPAGSYTSVVDAVAAGAPVIAIGSFINTIVNFVFIAFAIFMLLRVLERFKERFAKDAKAATSATPSAPPAEVVLLREIRDLLKERRG
jgi:large conductance mechanosensitive channel